MKEKRNPTYYALVPSDVRYDKDLTAFARLMYGEITALSNKKGYCWTSNRYFADLYDVTIQTITRWIKQLEDSGYITVEYEYGYSDKNKHPIKMRIIKIPSENSIKNRLECINNNDEQCINNNVKTNNNTSLINNDKSLSSFTNVKESNYLSEGLSPKDPAVTSQKGLFHNQSITKQKTKSLSQKDKLLIQTIDEFFINDNDLYFNHRLPTKENEYKTTALIKRVMSYIEQLQNGTFTKNIVLNDKQAEYNLSIIEKPMLLESVKDVLELAVDNWKTNLMHGYKPDNKEYMKKVSLDRWFYNERSQFSWFIECLIKEPELSMVADYKRIRDNIPKHFLAPFDKLYKYLWSNWEDADWHQYYLGIQIIYQRHKQLVSWYDGVVQRSGWRNYLASESMFAHSFYMWLRDYPYYNNLKLLSTNSQMWRDWRRYALGMWKTDVNPNQKFVDECIAENLVNEQERRRWASIEKAREKAEQERMKELW